MIDKKIKGYICAEAQQVRHVSQSQSFAQTIVKAAIIKTCNAGIDSKKSPRTDSVKVIYNMRAFLLGYNTSRVRSGWSLFHARLFVSFSLYK